MPMLCWRDSAFCLTRLDEKVVTMHIVNISQFVKNNGLKYDIFRLVLNHNELVVTGCLAVMLTPLKSIEFQLHVH